MARLIDSQGYEVLSLLGNSVYRLRDRLESRLGILAHYAPEEIIEQQVQTSKHLYGLREWRDILVDNAGILTGLLGPDLLCQREPYLRIARPWKPEDQIGIHRDTHYGASSSEWVLWIPLTNATDGAEMRILPGSHREPEEAYPWTQEQNATCERGSDRHWLGFRYAPKRMSSEVEARTVPIPCRVGEALLFNSACVHGQVLNTAPWTRVSIDIRLVPASTPVEHERGIRLNFYESLSVMEVA